MAQLPALRLLLRHINCFAAPPRPAMASLYMPRATWNFILSAKHAHTKTLMLHAALISKANHTLVLKKDERVVDDGTGEVSDGSTTIAAIVTSLGGPPGVVGIVRLSGPSAVSVAARVFRPARAKKKSMGKSSSVSPTWQPISHVVEYGVILDSDGNVIDEVLAVSMLAPRSYTREDVVELQCHGSEGSLHFVLF